MNSTYSDLLKQQKKKKKIPRLCIITYNSTMHNMLSNKITNKKLFLNGALTTLRIS